MRTAVGKVNFLSVVFSIVIGQCCGCRKCFAFVSSSVGVESVSLSFLHLQLVFHEEIQFGMFVVHLMQSSESQKLELANDVNSCSC
jgi:hypothetical protein